MDALIKGTDSVTGLAVPVISVSGSIRVTDTTGPQGDHPNNTYTPLAVTTTVAAAPPKRLSRLEQLREDAKAKAGQTGK